jgi:DNA-binding MarR family transcriptional regulator
MATEGLHPMTHGGTGDSTDDKATLRETLGLLRNVIVRVGPHRTPTGAELGVTTQQMTVLGQLIHFPGSTVGEVAERAYLAVPTVSRSLRLLEEAGLLERQRQEDDQRVVRLYPTERTVDVIQKIHVEIEELLERVLETMTQTEQKAVVLGLTALVEGLGKLGE